MLICNINRSKEMHLLGMNAKKTGKILYECRKNEIFYRVTHESVFMKTNNVIVLIDLGRLLSKRCHSC